MSPSAAPASAKFASAGRPRQLSSLASPPTPGAWTTTSPDLAGFVRGGNFIGASNNAVLYMSPRAGGFSANVLVGAGEGGAAATATGAPNGRNVGLALRYADGPLMATIAYNDSRRPDALLNRTLAYGATYDFGMVKGFCQLLGRSEQRRRQPPHAYLAAGRTCEDAGSGYHARGPRVTTHHRWASIRTSVTPGATAVHHAKPLRRPTRSPRAKTRTSSAWVMSTSSASAPRCRPTSAATRPRPTVAPMVCSSACGTRSSRQPKHP